ncbi:MAG TPA: hypothetical protein DDZ51_21290, partial [Planctomycetaceae bacterium]|nr:hypothetical protein [Planctomycetaceae bacterium]
MRQTTARNAPIIATARRFTTDDRFYFCHPETLDISEALPPKLHKRCDDALYLVNTIMRQHAYGRCDEGGRVTLEKKELDKVMAKDDSRVVIEALTERDVLDRDFYKCGQKSYGYMLHPRFVADRAAMTECRDRRLMRAWAKYRQQGRDAQMARWQQVHHDLAAQQWRLGIDLDQAMEIIASLEQEDNQYDAQRILVSDIAERRFRLSVGTWGRVSNNITSLKRELRKSLRFHGRPLEQVDRKNSQPTFLSHLVQRNPIQPTNRPDPQTHYDSENQIREKSRRYAEATGEGLFYEHFADLLEKEDVKMPAEPNRRDWIKRRVMADVLAKRRTKNGGEYASDVENVFRKYFPAEWRYARTLNRTGAVDEHANLIRRLQREESGLVIHDVAVGVIA